MENKKNKNDFPSGMDELNIKDHLNASFDMEKITVSEDLIARTLNKIKESEAEEENTQRQKKTTVPVYRYLSAAAAVLFVVVVGTALVKTGTLNINKRYNENSGTGANIEEYSMSAKENTAKDDLRAKESEDNSYDEGALQAEEKYSMQPVPEYENKSIALSGAVTFSQLYPVGNYSDIKSFTLSKDNNKENVLTLSGEKLEQLYSLLDGYELIEGIRNEKAAISYTVKIVTADNQEITIVFEEGINITYKTEDLQEEYFYTLNNWSDFIKKLDEFYGSLE